MPHAHSQKMFDLMFCVFLLYRSKIKGAIEEIEYGINSAGEMGKKAYRTTVWKDTIGEAIVPLSEKLFEELGQTELGDLDLHSDEQEILLREIFRTVPKDKVMAVVKHEYDYRVYVGFGFDDSSRKRPSLQYFEMDAVRESKKKDYHESSLKFLWKLNYNNFVEIEHKDFSIYGEVAGTFSYRVFYDPVLGSPIYFGNGTEFENEIKISDGEYRVKLTAPPVDGEANKKLVEILAEHFGVSKSAVNIVGGKSARTKIVDIL